MKKLTLALSALLIAGSAQSATFMSAEWAAEACKGWNNSDELLSGLSGDWIKNDAGRGYKAIQIYRSDCANSPKVELTIKEKDGKASCSYGGAVAHKELNSDVDYLMHATDEDWKCIGDNDWGCGAMGAMMTGKLKFDGPKGEAMSVMGPFEEFLILTGKIDSDRKACP